MRYKSAHRVPIIPTCQTDTCASELLRRHSFKKEFTAPPLTADTPPPSSPFPLLQPMQQ